jgi:choline dehydrogenase-like flavoprotein
VTVSSYDVIVIGSGAGGGTLVHKLAPSGKRILLLERGDWLPREPQNWLAHDVFVDNRYVSPDTWYDSDDKPFQPQVHYFVGGATKLYGAALYRLRAEDFDQLMHHDGPSPAWPVGYDQFEPYYTEAEALYRVHGARGEDPTEPPASAPYPFPPHAGSCSTRPTCRTAAACAARTATASRVWCTPSPTPRCSRSARRSSTRT